MDVAEWQDRNPLVVWRRERGWSQAGVALGLGVSVNTLRSWEQGASVPQPANMDRLVENIGPDLPGRLARWRAEKEG